MLPQLVILLLTLAGALGGAAAARLIPLPRDERARWLRPLVIAVGAALGGIGFVAWVGRALAAGGSQQRAVLGVATPAALLDAVGIAMLLRALRADGADDGSPAPAVGAVLLLAALGGVPLANVLTGGQALPWLGGVALWWLGGVAVLAVAALALARAGDSAAGRAASAVVERVSALSPRTFAIALALLALCLTIGAGQYVFHRQPYSADEVAQLWQAKILLSGRLALPPDPNPEFFAVDNVVDHGRWYSQFPVGGAAALALGVLMRAAWLVGPVLTALSAVAVYLFARRAYGERLARGGALLFALSPFVFFMGGTYMNHVPALFLTTLALAALPRWAEATTRRAAWWWAALLGVSVGGLAAVRPLDALAVAAVVGGAQLAALVRRHRPEERPDASSLVAELLAGAVPVAALCLTNWRTTGRPLRFGYEALYGAGHTVGFHVDPYGEPHTPLRALHHASTYLFQLHATAFGWPAPALLAVGVALLLARARSREWRHDALLVSLLLALLVAYALYWHLGIFVGPRYLFAAMPAVALLAARAPALAAGRLAGVPRRATLLAIPLATLAAWLPVRGYNSIPTQAALYRAQRLERPDAVALARAQAGPRALVLVDDGLAARTRRRLWALGVSRGDAAGLLPQVGDICGFTAAVDAEAGRPDTAQRLARLTTAAHARPGEPTPECAAELASNRESALEFGRFLLADEIGPDGRVGGDVVFVADMGARHDALLRQRFGDRPWYRLTAWKDGTEKRGTPTPRLEPYR